MFYTNEKSPKKVVEIIESIDGCLYFSSFDVLDAVMQSINFERDLRFSSLPLMAHNKLVSYVYTGIIHSHTVHLSFASYNENPMVKLTTKFYMKLNEDFIGGIRHRNEDLPSIIGYNDDGETIYLDYYIESEQKRINSQPIHISFDRSQKELITFNRYYKEDNYSVEDFSIYSVKYSKNKVIDAVFCYKNQPLKINTLKEMIPEIAELSVHDISVFKQSGYITPEVKVLLDIEFLK